MIAGPKYDVVADRHERLNGVVFENKAIVPDRGVVIAGPRTDVRRAAVTLRLCFQVTRLPDLIGLVIAQRDENLVFIG